MTDRFKVLVVDDNEVNRRVATLFLEKLGYATDAAEGGAECLDLHGRNRYDVIFLDVQMPGLDGLETARRLRDGAEAGHRPWIVGLSAATEEGETCREAGMDDYLTKPLRKEALEGAFFTFRNSSRRAWPGL